MRIRPLAKVASRLFHPGQQERIDFLCLLRSYGRKRLNKLALCFENCEMKMDETSDCQGQKIFVLDQRHAQPNVDCTQIIMCTEYYRPYLTVRPQSGSVLLSKSR